MFLKLHVFPFLTIMCTGSCSMLLSVLSEFSLRQKKGCHEFLVIPLSLVLGLCQLNRTVHKSVHQLALQNSRCALQRSFGSAQSPVCFHFK